MKDTAGEIILKKGEPIVIKYERILPETFNSEVIYAILFALAGIISIWAIEKAAEIKS